MPARLRLPNRRTPNPPPTYDPTDDFLLGSTTYNLGFISDDGYLYLGDTRPTSPVWSRYSLAGLGVSGTPVMPIIDACNFANGVLVTSTHAYRFTDIGSSSRAFSNSYALRYTTIYRSLQSERGSVSYTHLTLPTTLHECRSRWAQYH